MRTDTMAGAAAITVLNKFSAAYNCRDMDNLLSLFASHPPVVFIGTGADEKHLEISGIKKQFERNWAQSEKSTMEFTPISVSAAEAVAWAACDVKLYARVNGKDTNFSGRVTVVLQSNEGRWNIVQWHGSMPFPGQGEGESFPGRISTN